MNYIKPCSTFTFILSNLLVHTNFFCYITHFDIPETKVYSSLHLSPIILPDTYYQDPRSELVRFIKISSILSSFYNTFDADHRFYNKLSIFHQLLPMILIHSNTIITYFPTDTCLLYILHYT